MYSCTLLKKTFTCLTKFSRGNFHPIIESKADKINKYLKLCQSLSILSLTRHEQEFPFPTYSRYCLVNSSKLGLGKVFFISIPNLHPFLDTFGQIYHEIDVIFQAQCQTLISAARQAQHSDKHGRGISELSVAFPTFWEMRCLFPFPNVGNQVCISIPNPESW